MHIHNVLPRGMGMSRAYKAYKAYTRLYTSRKDGRCAQIATMTAQSYMKDFGACVVV